MRKSLVIVFAALALAASSALASANTITLELTSDHCTGSCGPQIPSFGTITLTELAANTVAVDITLHNGNKFVKTGFDGVVGFNLTGNQTLTVSSITSGWALLQAGPYAQFNGLGTFEYAITHSFKNGGAGAQPGPLNFTVSGTGLTAASFLELSTGPGVHAYFAVDILSGTTGKTGLVDATTSTTTITSVPDGGSAVTLLGSALFAIGILRRKLQRN